jgi:hypothetical protein
VCSNETRVTLNLKKFVNDSNMLSPLVVCTSTSRPVGSSVDELRGIEGDINRRFENQHNHLLNNICIKKSSRTILSLC